MDRVHYWLLGGTIFVIASSLLALKPRALLFPVTFAFAVVAWVKAVLTLPFLVREWLVAETLEKAARRDEAVASALHHHSAAAGVLWSIHTEYRPHARELFDKVIQGYGLTPRPHSNDPAVASAAAAVARSSLSTATRQIGTPVPPKS